MNLLNKFILLFCMLLFSSSFAFSVQPDEILLDSALEKRARAISLELRCLVCRNENIDSSDAELARDLRLLVRERLTFGESDEEVISYIRERYGDYVLLKPSFSGASIILWVIAPISFFMGLLLIYLTLFRSQKVRNEIDLSNSLTKQEQIDIKKLLDD